MSIEINFKGNRVGGNIDQNEPLMLGPTSFELKLMESPQLLKF